jgi:hypothetical protein
MGCATLVGAIVGSSVGTRLSVRVLHLPHWPGPALTSGTVAGLGIGLMVGIVGALWLFRAGD